MWFRQLIHREGESIAYVVACERTRQAVLVDPVAGAEPRYRNLLADHGFTLAYVLETTALAGQDQGHAPYAALLAELGLSSGDEQQMAAAATDERFGCPRIGPIVRWAADPEDPTGAGQVRVVAVGGTIVELTVCGANPPGGEALVVGRGGVRTFRLRFDRIGVRMGDVAIEAWATGLTENGLAYVLQDRALTGTPLLTHAPEGTPVAGGTPHALLSLSGDALLFPRAAPEGVFVATVHQERMWRTTLSGARETPSERRWQPVLHEGGTG